MFNLNDPEVPFLQEADIRKALLLGLNRQKIVNDFFNSQAIIANGVIMPGILGIPGEYACLRL